MKKELNRIAVFFGATLFLAMPVSAALHQGPPVYGEIVLSVEEHFKHADIDDSGLIGTQEYIAVSAALKQQSAHEARLDFNAMDMDDNGWLTFDEFYGELPSALTV